MQAKPSRDRKGEGFDISHYVRVLRGALARRRVGIGGSTSQFGGRPMLEPDADRVMAERREMLQDPYILDHEARPVVLTAIQRHCGCARQVQPSAYYRGG